MVKTIYLMRHGETLFNTQKRVQGWSDSPLTERGIVQAQAVGQYFKEQGLVFSSAYYSTHERATDTLKLVTDAPSKQLKGL
ncbi:phosphoglycerate mutase family protein, partial [Streptococcus suis]